MNCPTASLGEVADFVNGVAFKEADWGSEGRPIIRIQNLNDRSKPFNYTTRGVSEQNIARHGDLLVSWAASLGVYRWSGEEACINQHIFKVIPDRRIVDPDYLRRALEASLTSMEREAHGATMKHITRDRFLAVRIPLPGLPEQRRIAAILDKADALRAKRREGIAKLDQLLQSVFLDMFGDPVSNPKRWPRVHFADLLDRIESGSSPVCLNRQREDHEWGVLKLGAVTRCVFDATENKALPADAPIDPRLEVRKGDLLFSRKNTYELVAACAYVSKTPSKLLLPDLIFRLCLKDSAPICPRYLQALLTHPRKRKQMQSLAGGSAGSMPNISKAKLNAASIELPPLPLQQQFAFIAGQIEHQKSRFQQSTGGLLALFASLQNRAFSGTL